MSENTFTLMPTRPEHLPEIVDLERICFSQPWSYKGLLRAVSAPGGIFVSALDGEGKIAGYAGMISVLDEGYVTNVAVRPDCRRKGLGRMLLRHFREEGGSRGLRFISLEARVSNIGAIALYSLEGYSDMGVRPGYYDYPKEDARIMTLWLKADEAQIPSP